MRQDVLPGPESVPAIVAPAVIVGVAAAHIGLGVDAAAAAQHLSLRDGLHAAAELLLRDRAVLRQVVRVPVRILMKPAGMRSSQWSAGPPASSSSTPRPSLDQPRRRDAPGAAAADDDLGKAVQTAQLSTASDRPLATLRRMASLTATLRIASSTRHDEGLVRPHRLDEVPDLLMQVAHDPAIDLRPVQAVGQAPGCRASGCAGRGRARRGR